MKHAWVAVEPWDKEVAIAAIEAGADALVAAEGDTPKVKELGAVTTIAPDGDLRPGKDVVFLTVASKEDERKAAAVPAGVPLVLAMRDWTVIPLENLIAERGNLLVEVTTREQGRLALGVLEKGADGVLVRGGDPATVRQIVGDVRAYARPVALTPAEVVEVRPLGLGDRVCVDTCTKMGAGQGMLVGNTSGGFFLVHAESVDNPYVAARPFRVNAGAVHAYTLLPEGRTGYLSELKAGDEVLVVDHGGGTQPAILGRSKIEKRPMLLVRARAGEQEVSLVLQNAETIRLTAPDGQPVSVAALKPGDTVLAHLAGGGRHFGMKVEESLQEV